MTEDQIDKIQNEILNEMDKEEQIEKHIMISSDEIASQLLLTKDKITAEINNTPYLIKYRVIEKNDKKFLYVMAANMNKNKIAGNKYIPYTVNVEMDLRYSTKDNLKTAIEAFIRHITGRIKPEVLED